MFQIELSQLSKRFAGASSDAVAQVNLEVNEGERLVIVGPSGCGKTTVLRLIAGLETATSGTISIGGRRVNELPPRLRGVAMVFQHPALYPHLDAFDNLSFSLRARGVRAEELAKRTKTVADWLDLGGLLRRKPKALSGGERQRVAIGRAMVTKPAVLLLDEPFSSLDAPLRATTRETLLDLHQRLGGSLILVTHDQTEALAIGDRVALMRAGKVEAVGTPRDLYDHPPNRFVAGFLGDPPMSFLPCRFANGRVEIEPATPSTERIGFDWSGSHGTERIWLGVRPEAIRVNDASASAARLPATVERVEMRGHESIVQLGIAGHSVLTRQSAGFEFRAGDAADVCIDIGRLHWFARMDDARFDA